MTVDTSYTSGTSLYSGTTPSTAKNELDQQAFLQLLVAQLRNQDPSSPMDSSQLMAQTTQLSTMEQLTELTSTSREAFSLQMRVAAASLVGQTVSWTDADGVAASGIVDAVAYSGSVPVVTVGDQQIALDQVASVARTAAGAPDTDS